MNELSEFVISGPLVLTALLALAAGGVVRLALLHPEISRLCRVAVGMRVYPSAG